MTLYEFACLDEMAQAEAVWAATKIGHRQDQEHRILLYQIDGFYVEVYHDKDYNVLRRFRAFSAMEQLEPYLEEVDLRGLW